MNIYETNENKKENFLNTFQLLSSKQKKIWRYLQWYAQNFRNVFPSQETIAKAVGCHHDTVMQALKNFHLLGWLKPKKRCFRTNLYFIEEELVNIDTNKTEIFKLISESVETKRRKLCKTSKVIETEEEPIETTQNIAVSDNKEKSPYPIYKEQLKDKRWRDFSAKVKEKANWTCQHCEAKDKPLDVHHKKYVRGRLAWQYH